MHRLMSYPHACAHIYAGWGTVKKAWLGVGATNKLTLKDVEEHAVLKRFHEALSTLWQGCTIAPIRIIRATRPSV